MYLDLNNSRLHVLAKIIYSDGLNIGANTAGPINLPLHSMFREIFVKLNGRNVSDTSPLYPYRACLETLLNFSKETQDTRLQCEGWTKDSSENMGITEVAGANAGLNTRAVTFSTSTVVELVGRPHLDVLNQDRLIPPAIDLHMKLIPAADSFVCKSAAFGAGAAQQYYKMAIQQVDLIIHTKQLTSTSQKGYMELLRVHNMRTHYSRDQVKHLSIPANQTSISFENVFTGALPDMVIVGLVSDADHAGEYQRNPFNFKNFGVNRIDLTRNGMPVPRNGYTPNFTIGQYKTDYMTFLEQLDCESGDQCISLTPSECATGYTLYAVNITDGPIGPGTYGPRSKSATGSVSLEVSFAAVQNENIKVILLSQMLGRLEFDQFQNVIVYERWWTSRWKD